MNLDTNIEAAAEAPGYYVAQHSSIRRAAAYVLGSMRAADLYAVAPEHKNSCTMEDLQGTQVLREVIEDTSPLMCGSGTLEDLIIQDTAPSDFINALAAIASHALRELEPRAEEREAWLRRVILDHICADDPVDIGCPRSTDAAPGAGAGLISDAPARAGSACTTAVTAGGRDPMEEVGTSSYGASTVNGGAARTPSSTSSMRRSWPPYGKSTR